MDGFRVGKAASVRDLAEPLKGSTMLTHTSRLSSSTNGESTNGKPYPMHKPAGDSCVLLVPVGPEFKPNGATSTPGERSLRMPRELANSMAVDMNRLTLRKFPHCPHWHIVIYGPQGFYVVKVQTPEDWQAEDEYSLPPVHISDVMNVEARNQVKVINRAFIESGRSVKHWAVHVKPLRRTEKQVGTFPPETPIQVKLESPETLVLSEGEQQVLDTLNESLNGKVEAIDDCGSVRFVLRNYYLGESTRWKCDEPAGIFRNLAGRLLDAANKLEGKNGPALGSLHPLFYEYTIEGFETVTLRVDVTSGKDEEEEKALQTARQFMLAHSR